MKVLVIVGLIATCLLATAQSKTISNRLANGSNADEQVPWNVYLIITNTAIPGAQSLGSGVLVTPRRVLTAAFNILNFNRWHGGVGSTALSELTYFQSHGAFVHENYNPNNFNNNIGVILFPMDIVAPNVAPATLPPFGENTPSAGDLGRLAGFGFISSAQQVQPEHLQSGTQTVLSQSICESEFPALGETLNTQFCAISIMTQVTPCGGEQGGGFDILRNNQRWVVGLISHTQSQCESPTSITYYVSIAHFRIWILINAGV